MSNPKREIQKYKRFKSSAEFERWQEENCVDIISVSPLPLPSESTILAVYSDVPKEKFRPYV